MGRFTRTTLVDAPLDRVWDFHSRIEGLEAITPGWMGLTVESVEYPSETVGDVLVPGTVVEARMAPFGLLPAGRWRSQITHRERDDEAAAFRDVMLRGPLHRWEHAHRFAKATFGTVVHDEIEYVLPASIPDPLARPGLEMLFAYRHRRTADLLA